MEEKKGFDGMFKARVSLVFRTDVDRNGKSQRYNLKRGKAVRLDKDQIKYLLTETNIFKNGILCPEDVSGFKDFVMSSNIGCVDFEDDYPLLVSDDDIKKMLKDANSIKAFLDKNRSVFMVEYIISIMKEQKSKISVAVSEILDEKLKELKYSNPMLQHIKNIAESYRKGR